MARKTEEEYVEAIGGHGKKENQKLKPLLVLMYLMRNTDENHFATGKEIAAYLIENDIWAERRSIYSDIDQINKVLYMIENQCSLSDAIEELAEADDFEKPVIYDEHHKGYRLKHQNYEFDDVRLLVESIYAAKFIDQRASDTIIDIACRMVSEHQAEKLRHEVLNIDHIKTENQDVFFNVTKINEAMSTKVDGQKHEPEKIRFNYMKYSINDMKQSISKRGGEKITVSPYQLIISDGNYYLRCFDDRAQAMRTYRVDRMSKIELTGQPREGKEAAAAEDYKSYMQRVFSMFGGEKTFVALRFTASLLDTVIDKFGKDKSKYTKIDEHHFEIRTAVEISPQFFSWICGFGTKVEILDPKNVRDQYVDYIKSIVKKYEK